MMYMWSSGNGLRSMTIQTYLDATARGTSDGYQNNRFLYCKLTGRSALKK